MANKIPGYPSFRGTNYTCYEISVTKNGQGQFVASQIFLGGTLPTTADSGEILVKLDWSTVAGAFQASTLDIATAVAPALQDTNFIPALGGRALAELPIHLAGHSRGGAVISGLARLVCAPGIWGVHITFLDPHPVSLFSDPTVKTYANVLFADNYWQDLGDNVKVPNGTAITGAYNRHLTNLNGGYSSTHSDVHLCYHGTIDWAVPASDTGANITATERATWWTASESSGHATGFLFTLIGGGDRLSSAEPAGAGNGRIRDGFNQQWDLGAGVAANRTALPANNGAWPNLIRCDVTSTNAASVDDPVAVRVYFQFGQTASSNTDIRLFLDRDSNPYNANAVEVFQSMQTGTGIGAIRTNDLQFIADPLLVAPGLYRVGARINGSGHTRWLYAPPRVQLSASRIPPRLTPLSYTNNTLRLRIDGFTGQTVVIAASTNLADWIDVATNALISPPWEITDPAAASLRQRFYRGRLAP